MKIFTLTSWFRGFQRRSEPAVTAIWPRQETRISSTSFTDGTLDSGVAGGSATSCETMGFNRTCSKFYASISNGQSKIKRLKDIKHNSKGMVQQSIVNAQQ